MTAGDLGEGVEDLTEVLGEEVAWEAVVEAVDYALQMVVSSGECVVMASVGDDDVILLKSGDVGSLIDGSLEGLDALAVFGGDGNGC